MAGNKLPDVWTERDFPVLLEVARRMDGGEATPSIHDVAQSLDMPVDQVQLAGAALKRRGLVDGFGSMQAQILRFRHLSGEAYLLNGLHPDGCGSPAGPRRCWPAPAGRPPRSA